MAYQKKLHQLDGRQQELVKDNFELKDLCLYLDEERLRSGGLTEEAAAATFPSDTKCPKCGHSWPVSSKSSIEKAPPIHISSPHSGEACYDRNASTPSPLVAADPSEVTNDESDSRFGNIALEFENSHHFRQVGLHAEHKKSSETSSSSNDSNGSAAGEAETSSMETVSSTSKSQSQETQLAMQILSSFHEQSQKQRQEAEGEPERSCFDFQTEKAILQEMCLLVQRTFDSDV